jgi:hypothetical protein
MRKGFACLCVIAACAVGAIGLGIADPALEQVYRQIKPCRSA